jgi:hypothetical protein
MNPVGFGNPADGRALVNRSCALVAPKCSSADPSASLWRSKGRLPLPEWGRLEAAQVLDMWSLVHTAN